MVKVCPEGNRTKQNALVYFKTVTFLPLLQEAKEAFVCLFSDILSENLVEFQKYRGPSAPPLPDDLVLLEFLTL